MVKRTLMFLSVSLGISAKKMSRLATSQPHKFQSKKIRKAS